MFTRLSIFQPLCAFERAFSPCAPGALFIGRAGV